MVETDRELAALEKLLLPEDGRPLVEDASLVFFGSLARGESTSQVPDANVALVASGPMVTPVSSCIFGSEATL